MTGISTLPKIAIGLANRIEQLKYDSSEHNVFSVNREYVVHLLATVMPEDTDEFERHEQRLTDALNMITSTFQEMQSR